MDVRTVAHSAARLDVTSVASKDIVTVESMEQNWADEKAVLKEAPRVGQTDVTTAEYSAGYLVVYWVASMGEMMADKMDDS